MTQKAGTLFLLLGMTFTSGVGFSADPATGAQFEKRIYNIYKSNGLAPVGDREWSEIVGRAQTESYVVRKGDTLWGLSAAFFGDGLYWPKIWSLNDRITNPHLIYPSAEIRFSSGTLEQPPGIQVVGQETLDGPEMDPTGGVDGAAPPANAEVVETIETDTEIPPAGVSYEEINKALYPGAPRLPPSRSKTNPVGAIPPAFETSSFSVERFDESGVSFDVRPPAPVASQLFAHSFFFEGSRKEYPSVGTVLEIEDGQDSIGFGGLVYLDTDSETAVGDTFTVISKDFPKTVNGRRGTVFRYSGVVQVVEALGSTRYRATVVSALFPIFKDSLLTKEQTPTFSDEVGAKNSDRFEVEAGAYNRRRDLFGEGAVIFLGGGRDSNIQVGDVFGIYKNRKVRYRNSKMDQSPRPIAAVKVFRLGERTASALIISSSEPVRIGDFTGTLDVGQLNISVDERQDIDDLESTLDGSSEGPLSDPEGDNLSLDDIPDEDGDFGEEDFEGEDLDDFGAEDDEGFDEDLEGEDAGFDDFENDAESEDLAEGDALEDDDLDGDEDLEAFGDEDLGDDADFGGEDDLGDDADFGNEGDLGDDADLEDEDLEGGNDEDLTLDEEGFDDL